MAKEAETPIARYKARHGLTYSQVASRLGITCHYARQLGCGSVKRVSPRLAEQIELRSDGEITRHEMVFPDSAA